ncbi:MAG: PIN domain protein [Herpetosiphonaceae bacterium]|nr:PIN domain protein [Herpetosiphonaceae bacterium]
MKVQRVYIDTSVVGGCFDVEFAKWSNALIDDFRFGRLKPVLSEVIEAEIQDAPEPVQALYIELLTLSPDVVSSTRAALDLADVYQQRGILTPKYYADGLHIALATIAEVDVLVSWNFKHIVHLDKIRLFNAVNLEAGYKPLQIYSPREVATYEDDH